MSETLLAAPRVEDDLRRLGRDRRQAVIRGIRAWMVEGHGHRHAPRNVVSAIGGDAAATSCVDIIITVQGVHALCEVGDGWATLRAVVTREDMERELHYTMTPLL